MMALIVNEDYPRLSNGRVPDLNLLNRGSELAGIIDP